MNDRNIQRRLYLKANIALGVSYFALYNSFNTQALAQKAPYAPCKRLPSQGLTFPPIPPEVNKNINWYSLPIQAIEDPLVPIGAFSQSVENSHELFTSSVYFGEHANSPYSSKLDGALLGTYVRKKVAIELLKAQCSLPENYYFIIFDAYRPFKIQKSLYKYFYQQLAQQNPHLSPKELRDQSEKFVAYPSTNPKRPSSHNTGGTVDVALFTLTADQSKVLSYLNNLLKNLKVSSSERVNLERRKELFIRKYGKQVSFGTSFDNASEQAASRYYEEKIQNKVLLTTQEELDSNARRILVHTLQKTMLPIASEWWHFNHIFTQAGASKAGKKQAKYGPAIFDQKCKKHEKLRLAHYQTPDQKELEDMPLDSVGRWPIEVISPQKS